jgi:hypothetical protein
MRKIDGRVRVGRRSFLQGSAAAAAAGVTFSATSAWAADAKTLTPHQMATLALMARDIFPHDRLADVYYVRAVTPYDAKAGGDAAFHEMIAFGIERADQDARAHFNAAYLDVPWEEQRVVVLQGMEQTPFFAKVHGDLVVSLYNQKEVWAKFGYEGSSAEHGGYIHRGFNDIDWLPSV